MKGTFVLFCGFPFQLIEIERWIFSCKISNFETFEGILKGKEENNANDLKGIFFERTFFLVKVKEGIQG